MQELGFFIFAFTSFFIIVNPVGGLITFVSLTRDLSDVDRAQVALRSTTLACVLALVFALAGDFILRSFNITVDNLRVAGGVLLFIVALDMLQARISRESVTPEEMRDASNREQFVFPLASPLLTGPGAMTTALVLMRSGGTILRKSLTLLAIFLTFVIAYLTFRFSQRLYRLMGVTVTLAITRIMGLLLAAMAVNFIAEGAWNIFQALKS